MLNKKIYCSVIFLSFILTFSAPAYAASPVHTEHFRIMGFGGDVKEDVLKKIGDDLESAYADITDFLGVDSYKSGKIEASVYTKPQAGRGTRAHAGATSIVLDANYTDRELLRHELTHILIHKPLPSAPTWFHEGLAQYVGYGDIRNFSLRNNKAMPPASFKDFSFIRLEARFGADRSEGESYFYSWSIMSYLLDVYGKDKLKQVFKEKGNFSDRFGKAFGVELKAIEKKADEIFNKYKTNVR